MTRLGHQNVANTKFFGTFISRLFVGSFRNDGVIQDFKWETSKNSIAGLIQSMIGEDKMEEALGVPMDVFNSTSLSISYYLSLMDKWASKKQRNRPVHKL